MRARMALVEKLKAVGATAVLLGFFVLPPVIAGVLSREEPETTGSSYTSWESDTSSDEPEDTFVESAYVDNRGTYDCTEDCSGHSAGYDWAAENEVCDTEFDGGGSESFAEGVRQWAEDNCTE